MADAFSQLLGSVLALIVMLYGLLLILGQQRMAARATAGIFRFALNTTIHLLRVVVLVIISTLTLLFRIPFHIGQSGQIANDLARWVERVTDAVIAR